MTFARTLAIALLNLRTHAFRSFLTALGVIFGVGAVVGMMAVSAGAEQEALRELRALGEDLLVSRSLQPTSGQDVSQESRHTAVEYGVTQRDIQHIDRVFDNVLRTIPVRDTRKSIYASGKRTDIRVFGVTPAFLDVTRSRLADSRGRFLEAMDEERFLTTCVLGTRAARRIFGHRDPLGQTIPIGAGAFRVVGLFENPYRVKLGGVYDLDNQILVPLRTANAVFGEAAREMRSGGFENTKVDADYLYVAVRRVEEITQSAARLRAYLAETHPTGDYEIQVPYELMKQREAVQRRASIVLGAIAAISLLVGGIGIMNIMMANVYERTKEIGVRRALGARKRDILLQFLSESVLLTVIGGLVGIGLGYGMAFTVKTQMGMLTVVTPVSVALSFLVAVSIGVVFGTYPAAQAAGIDPIAALRRE